MKYATGMFKAEWPKAIKDPYATGQNPPARPVSNHNTVYGKDVYKSNYNPSGDRSAHKGEKVAMVGNSAKMQPKDLSKVEIVDKKVVPSYQQVLKKDKY